MTMTSTAPSLFQLARQVEDRDTIAALAAGDDEMGRLGVAVNSDAPPEIIRVLAHDPNAAIRLQALIHPACPTSARNSHRDDLPALVDQVAAMIADTGGDVDGWRDKVNQALAKW